MLFTYQECISKYGNDYLVKKALLNRTLFQIEKGLYSDKQYNSENEIVMRKYPGAVYTGKSAYYYHGLSDVIPDYHYIATKRSATRIKDNSIKQIFITNEVFDMGIETMIYQDVEIRVYDIERLLVELIRFRSKESIDYYKEVVASYRDKIYEMDFEKIEKYASKFKSYKRIMDTVQMEIM